MTDSFNSRFGFMPRSFNPNALLNFSPLTKEESTFLTKIYSLMAAGLFATVGGVLFNWHVWMVPSFIDAIGTIGCMIYVMSKSGSYHSGADKDVQLKRFVAYEVMCAFVGMGLSRLIGFALYVNPAIIVTAVTGAAAIFVSLSLAALFARARSMLFLGGALLSGVNILMWTSLINIFVKSTVMHDVSLYGGLILYLGFILFDTQLIVAEHKNGNRDVFKGVISLYLDLIQVFVRIVQILLQKEADNDRKKRRND